MTDGARPRFVVQRHDATTLHFDLRLEVDGVLASWAVPKGPPTGPGMRRLAVRTGDHDLAYADYEGPTGTSRRGPSSTTIWDSGSYANRTQRDGRAVPVAEALTAGHLRFELDGRVLTGEFALTRTAMDGDDRNWILIKVADPAHTHSRSTEAHDLR